MFTVRVSEHRDRVVRALGGLVRARVVSAAVAGSLTVTSLLWVLGMAPATAAQGPTRIFVAVHDSTGAPVTDLAAADFLIRVDGADRQILSVTPATTPLSIVLFTDQLGLTSTIRLTDLGEPLAAFLTTFRGPCGGSGGSASFRFKGAPQPFRTRFPIPGPANPRRPKLGPGWGAFPSQFGVV